jgi:DNA-binding NarL/FixJ family response regulator
MASLIQRQADMIVVGEAADGNEALAQFRQHRPDITLMDLRMPGMDGVAAITAIRAEVPDARVIVLTTFDDDEDIRRALHAGAKGYLLKDAGREALLEAIRAVHAGQTRVSPELATRVLEQSRGGQRLSENEKRAVAERPLWLTAEQAATLLSLSSTSRCASARKKTRFSTGWANICATSTAERPAPPAESVLAMGAVPAEKSRRAGGILVSEIFGKTKGQAHGSNRGGNPARNDDDNNDDERTNRRGEKQDRLRDRRLAGRDGARVHVRQRRACRAGHRRPRQREPAKAKRASWSATMPGFCPISSPPSSPTCFLANGIPALVPDRDTPTPVVAYTVRARDLAGAVMLTASHNPPEYNGIKFIPDYCHPALPDVTDAITATIGKLQAGQGQVRTGAAKSPEKIDPKPDYFAHVRQLIDMNAIGAAGLKIYVDPLHAPGAAI